MSYALQKLVLPLGISSENISMHFQEYRTSPWSRGELSVDYNKDVDDICCEIIDTTLRMVHHHHRFFLINNLCDCSWLAWPWWPTDNGYKIFPVNVWMDFFCMICGFLDTQCYNFDEVKIQVTHLVEENFLHTKHKYELEVKGFTACSFCAYSSGVATPRGSLICRLSS